MCCAQIYIACICGFIGQFQKFSHLQKGNSTEITAQVLLDFCYRVLFREPNFFELVLTYHNSSDFLVVEAEILIQLLVDFRALLGVGRVQLAGRCVLLAQITQDGAAEIYVTARSYITFSIDSVGSFFVFQ